MERVTETLLVSAGNWKIALILGEWGRGENSDQCSPTTTSVGGRLKDDNNGEALFIEFQALG